VLLDGENGIIAGHGRVLAARKLGMTEVPCIELAHLSPVQRRAYILADNKLALNAGWDDEMLRLELGELSLGGFDLSLTGFGELEIKALLADKTQGRTDPDDTPDPPAHPVSQPGDLWFIAGHGRVLAARKLGMTEVPCIELVVSQPGDLWLLGAKVTCPGCGKAQPLERAMTGAPLTSSLRRAGATRHDHRV
jgi:ParB-like chromosome segregation protein Spo0J